MISRKWILIFLVFTFQLVKAQSDSTSIFEKSKGTWPHPLDFFSNIIHNSDTSIFYPYDYIIYSTPKSIPVKAVFEGKVFNIINLNGMYTVTIKYARYYISYVGLIKPVVNKGDILKQGQVISNGLDYGYYLTIFLSKNGRQIDIRPWFK